MVSYVAVLPCETAWNSQNARAFLVGLLERYQYSSGTQRAYYLIGITANSEEVMWKIQIYHEKDAQALAELIWTYYPDALLYEGVLNIPKPPILAKTAVFSRPYDSPFYVPMFLPISRLTGNGDPLINMVNAMSSLQMGEIIDLTIDLMSYEKHKFGFWQRMMQNWVKEMQKGNNPYAQTQMGDLQKQMDERMQEKLVLAQIAVTMWTHDSNRFYVLDNVIGATSSVSPLGMLGQFVPYTARADNDDQISDAGYLTAVSGLSKKDYEHSMYGLTADELASLWHFPHDYFNSDKVKCQKPQKCISPELQNIEGIPIGTSCNQEVKLPVDDRTTHTMIIGKNGTGKTSLMHRMIHADIADGRGVCVIDPQGKLIPKILQSSIPDERIDDVVILDLAMEIDGTRYPPPINPLFKASGEVSLMMLGLMEKVYGDFQGTRMETLLKMALRTLGGESNPTLMSIRKLYRDDAYRNKLLPKVDSISIEDQWNDFLSKSEKNQDDMTFPLFQKLDRFYDLNEALAVTCHPEPLDYYKLVQENKIILVSLGSQGTKLGDDERQILGTAIVGQIEAVAMAGAITKPPFLLYIDEADMFVNTPLDKMLSKVRQHGLGLVLINQFLKQLTGEVQDAVEGNVGTMFSFEIGHSDSKIMRHYMNNFEADELVALGKFKAAVSMRYQGDRQPAFLMETWQQPGHDADEATLKPRELEVRRTSVANYTPKSYDEVISWVRNYYASGNNKPDESDDSDNDWTEAKPE